MVGIVDGGNEEKKRETIFIKVMAERFPELMKDMNP